jgi:S-adenosylmethionine hydrolase
MENLPPIAVITDFGLDDPFVGVMKGVIAGIAPQALIVDICHTIPQGDIQRAAIQLWMSKKFFPEKTIFLVVVDPGVGTERKALVVDDGDFYYVGPDNGVLSFGAGANYQAFDLSNPEYQLAAASSTFHGRDIFAPAAAHLANGIPRSELGNRVETIIFQSRPHLSCEARQMKGEIIYIDQFGNLMTSLGEFTPGIGTQFYFEPWVAVDSGNEQLLEIDLAQAELLLPGKNKIPWGRTFADIPTQEIGFLVGSTGLIEIVVRNQSAQLSTKLNIGDPVTLLL